MKKNIQNAAYPLILSADDQQFMRMMIRDALNGENYQIIEAENGQGAYELYKKFQPDIVLMDAIMPVMDGFEATEAIRQLPTGQKTPIILVTALGDTNSINKGFEAGATDFLIKPINFDILRRRLSLILREKNTEESLRKSEERFRLLAENALDCIMLVQLKPGVKYEYISPVITDMLGYQPEDLYNSPHLIYNIIHPADKEIVNLLVKGEVSYKFPFEIRVFHREGHIVYTENHVVPVYNVQKKLIALQIISRDITERKKEELRKRIELTQKVLYETVKALSATIETRDPYTFGHQFRVAQLVTAIAKKMDFDLNQLDGLNTAAVLHDIGKITVPAEYLSKPGRLTNAEFSIIQTHAEVGYEILKPIEFPWPTANTVWQHHERIDGSGYPLGLTGDQITIEAKILAVSDVVEAMTNHRPYRVALGIDKALEEISQNSGRLYEPSVVEACLSIFTKREFTFQ